MGFGLLCLFIASASAAAPPMIKIGNTYYTPLIREPMPSSSNRQHFKITFPGSTKFSGGYNYAVHGTVPQNSGYDGYPASSGGYDDYSTTTTTTQKPRSYEYKKPQGYHYPRPAPIAETTTTEAELRSTTEQPDLVFPDKDYELNKIPSAIGLETIEDNESQALEPTPFPTPVHDQPDFEINDEPCNLPDTENSWPCGLANSIPGKAGEDYPIYSAVPKTSFRCPSYSGYFGDMESRCQSFHVCLTRENRPAQKYSFLCPNGTVFNQREFVCTWWTEFTCSDTTHLYRLNQDLDWEDADMIKRGSSMLKVTPYNSPAPAVPKKQPKPATKASSSKKPKKSSNAIVHSASFQTVGKTRTEVKKQKSESEAYEDKYDAEAFIVNRAPIPRFPPVKVQNPHGISIPNDPFEEEFLQVDPQTPPTPAPQRTSTSQPERATYLPPRRPPPTYLPPKAEATPEVDERDFEPAPLPLKTQPERDFVPPTQVVPTYLPPQKTYLPPRTTLPPLIETTTDRENQLSPDPKIPETYPEIDFETTPKPKLTYLPPGNATFAFRVANNKIISDILGSSNIVDHLPEEHFTGFTTAGSKNKPQTNALVPPAPRQQLTYATASQTPLSKPTQQPRLIYVQLPPKNYATSAPIHQQQQRTYAAEPSRNYQPPAQQQQIILTQSAPQRTPTIQNIEQYQSIEINAQQFVKQNPILAPYNQVNPEQAQPYNQPNPVPAEQYNQPNPVPAQQYNQPNPVPAQQYNHPNPVPAQQYNQQNPVPAQQYNQPNPIPAQQYNQQNSFPPQPVYQLQQPVVPVQYIHVQPSQQSQPRPTQYNLYPAPTQPVYNPPPQPQVYLQTQPQNQAPTPAVYLDQTPSPQTLSGSTSNVNPKDIPQLIRAINIHSSFLIGKDIKKVNNGKLNQNPVLYEVPKDTSISKAQSYYGPLKVVSVPKLQNLLENPKQIVFQVHEMPKAPVAAPTFYEAPKVQPTYQAPQAPLQKALASAPTFYETPKVQPTYQAPKHSIPKVPSFVETEAQKAYHNKVASFVETAKSKSTYHKSTVSVPKVPTFLESVELQNKLQTPIKVKPILSIPTSATSTFYKGPQAESFQKSVTIHSSHYTNAPKATPHNPYYSPGPTEQAEEDEPQEPIIHEQQQEEEVEERPIKHYSKPTHSFHTYSAKPTYSSLDNNDNYEPEPSYKYNDNVNVVNSFSHQKRPPTLLIPSSKGSKFRPNFSKSRTKGW